MINQDLSEGARRALKRAETLAYQQRADSVEPKHLLWALLLEESHAAELMLQKGLTHEILSNECLIDPAVDREHGNDVQGESFTYHQAVANAVSEALGLKALIGPRAELGSDALLFGLASIASPVVEILERHELDREAILEHIRERTGYDVAPIAVDISIRSYVQPQSDRTDTLRVIDAAANRAHEGFRVVEDFARFILDDSHLTSLLKQCRHDLTECLKSIGERQRLAARDTLSDVGTRLQTARESFRGSPVDVLRANCKRTEEALRTLEEFSKIISPDCGSSLEKIRYRMYTLEKALLTAFRGRNRLDGCRLYLLVTESHCHHGSGPAIRGALQAGVDMVQVREKSMPDRRLIEHCRWVRKWTSEAEALMIMNDRPDLAVLAGADGVHVGQDELTVRQARRIVGPERLVGVSTHNIEQARQAVLDGADYLGVGPVFSSQTKDFDELAGLEFVQQVADEITLPWFAIGGINGGNVESVLDAGATRVAVSNVICAAEDPNAAAAGLVDQLRHSSLENG